MSTKTIVLSARISVADLATVVRFLKDRGFSPRSGSEAILLAVRLAASSIDNSYHFSSPEEALEYLAENRLLQRSKFRQLPRPDASPEALEVYNRLKSSDIPIDYQSASFLAAALFPHKSHGELEALIAQVMGLANG